MPVRPLCHGAEKVRSLSHALPRKRLDQVVVEVGHLGGVQRLDPPEGDHPGGHPVGQHEHVALDGLAVAELVAHLGEELGVVVDVVGVLDGDAGLGLEHVAGVGRPVRPGVDVGRPVADDQLLVVVRDVLGDARGRVLGRPVGAEQRQHGDAGDSEDAQPCPTHQRPSAEARRPGRLGKVRHEPPPGVAHLGAGTHVSADRVRPTVREQAIPSVVSRAATDSFALSECPRCPGGGGMPPWGGDVSTRPATPSLAA